MLQALLRNGATKSCGCLHRDVASSANITHGHAKRDAHTPEYRTWKGMLSRCEIQTATHYPAYGGKGINVCAGWHDFASFFADMGPKVTSAHSIDRKDNDRGYDCGRCLDCLARGATANCRWATAAEQSRNRGNSVIVEHEGRRRPLVDLARENGVSYGALYKRIERGQSLGVALAALCALRAP